MNERGKSDSPVVPAKLPNKAARVGVAEVVVVVVEEEEELDRNARFTALLHHVDVDRLRSAYWAIRPQVAPGVDGVRWHTYGQDLEARLRDLCDRVHSGAYRASPSRRVYIPKPVGRQRPLGIAGSAPPLPPHCCSSVSAPPCA